MWGPEQVTAGCGAARRDALFSQESERLRDTIVARKRSDTDRGVVLHQEMCRVDVVLDVCKDLVVCAGADKCL